MEVCGGQTHSLLRHGIDVALAGVVELIHGPGCPVCVTPLEAIDFACHLSRRENIVLTSFGDMLHVPGSTDSLAEAPRRRWPSEARVFSAGRRRTCASRSCITDRVFRRRF